MHVRFDWVLLSFGFLLFNRGPPERLRGRGSAMPLRAARVAIVRYFHARSRHPRPSGPPRMAAASRSVHVASGHMDPHSCASNATDADRCGDRL